MTPPLADALLTAIRTRTVRAGVVGLGYVGLPLAVEFARAGYRTVGIDLDATKVTTIREGRSYIDDVSAHDVAQLRTAGFLDATTDFEVVSDLDTVNIGLVNELALMCDRLGIDVWEVVDAAATKPFGFMPFYPGPGLGGHCIPVDPFYLSWKARQSGFEARFIELAGAINGAMPHYVVSLVIDALNTIRLPLHGSRVLVAGVAYKRNVDDIRESPALDVLSLLLERGAVLSYSDPHVPSLSGRLWKNGIDLEHVDLATVAPGSYDCIVVVTDHDAFARDGLQLAGRMVVDTRDAIKAPGPHVFRLGAPRPQREVANLPTIDPFAAIT